MTVSLNSVVPFSPMQVTRSCVGSSVTKSVHISSPLLSIKSKRAVNSSRRVTHVLAAESDSVMAELGENPSLESVTAPEKPSNDSEKTASASAAAASTGANGPADTQTKQKKVPLTARERLRAARVLSRYSDSKPAKSEMGRSVLDALRESEKGKKGLPQAPTNLLDDAKRGMPKAGLTFDLPGGYDLFVIAVSFVLISTIMFATTYFVWKVGAIHFNDN